MPAFDNARRFFAACDGAQGWAACEALVEPGATFACQAAALQDITTVADYCEWMKGIGSVTAPDASYVLHGASFDEESRVALFFATIHLTHTGPGGPVPPTGRDTSSDYVYALTMSANDKVERLEKVWNDGWAMAELGWA
ncbi:MAG: hypothetical protein F4X36_14420 [Gammaproteobacteria bacterium]|nr:hypothetical protein [Gammaproteobacteria bacterium]